MRLLFVPALMLPLALAACDDGSERIAELEGTLQTERTRISTLEGQVGEIETLRTERDALVKERDELIVARDTAVGERDQFTPQIETLTTERDTLATERDTLVTERDALTTERDTLVAERDTLVSERDTLAAERDRLQGELETVQARVVELERTATEGGDAFDTATLKEPMQAILVKLRETQAGLEELETRYGSEDGIREAVTGLRTRIGETGQDIRTIVERAKIELE